jgi:hypothetical protein
MSGAIIETFSNGSVMPLTKLEFAAPPRKGSFDGGAYYENGNACPLSIQAKGSYDNIPKPLHSSELNHFPGHHVFCGMLQNEHFGHFITESLSRLWAFDQLSPKFDTAVFYLRDRQRPIAPFVFETLGILLPHINLLFADRPMRFDTLAVPQQLANRDNGFIYGHPLNIEMFRRLRQNSGGPARKIGAMRGYMSGSRQVQNDELPKKVYVSRSRLSRRQGGILSDQLIDHHMVREGYTVIYPETMSISEQLAIYAAAEKLVFSEGSALHLYALVANAKQSVFVIWRRTRTLVFDWQIRSFTGKGVLGNSHTTTVWVPKPDIPDPVHGQAVLDFTALSTEMRQHGFLEGGLWDNPPQQAREEQLATISAATGREYLPFPSQS